MRPSKDWPLRRNNTSMQENRKEFEPRELQKDTSERLPSLRLLMPFPALTLEFLPPPMTPSDEEPIVTGGRQNIDANEPN